MSEPYPVQSIKDRYHQILTSFRHCGAQQPVQLIAVSKKQSADKVRSLFQLGQEAFGENYLQEALQKQSALLDLTIEWHFIGHIQRNKTKDIAQHFAWVHTVDRLLIAQRLGVQRLSEQPLNVCLQVNVEQEPTKTGCTLDDLPMLVAQVSRIQGLKLRGLMCIPSPEGAKQVFGVMKQQFDQLRDVHANPLDWDTLSMGMSEDYMQAIAQGATMVRIGSLLFGAR